MYVTCTLRCSHFFSWLLQHHTFYDFIVNKARGKSGPLFNFDVHDDVRLLADASVEKDESHAGKVVERSWYQRNKHIFPASRWEVGRNAAYGFPMPSPSKIDHNAVRFMTQTRTTGSIPLRDRLILCLLSYLSVPLSYVCISVHPMRNVQVHRTNDM